MIPETGNGLILRHRLDEELSGEERTMTDPPRAALLANRRRRSRAIAVSRGARQWLISMVLCGIVACAGCTSLLLPSGPGDRESERLVDRNTRNLRRLQVGLFQEYVANIMGEPQRIEVYPWGIAWLYRTGTSKRDARTPKADFTPLVFDRSGVLLGWGPEVLSEQVNRDGLKP